MTILHLTTFLQGGAGRVITDLAIAQSRAGYQAAVVASRTGVPGYGNYDGYLEELEAHHVPVHLVDSMFVRETAANLAVVRFLDDLCAGGLDPDVIHTHAGVPSFVALMFARARRQPMAIVQTMHGWGVAKTSEQAAADVAVMNLVDRVAVPSQQSAAAIAALGVDQTRTCVVPYGVSEQRQPLDESDCVATDAMALAKSRGAMVVGCVGTIGRRKNQALLIESLALAQRQIKTFGLFVGDGDVDGLRAHADATAGCGEVCVRGYSRSARALAAHADVLVLPSSSEGQPIAVLEAFCDRTLVAVSSIPELSELVEAGVTGIRFAPGDARSLAHALVRISQMSGTARREMQDRARARYLSDFTAAAMADAYLELYDTARGAPTPVRRRREASAA